MNKSATRGKSPYHKESFINTPDGHEIWYGVAGNPDGVPVVSLHGGPGSSSKIEYLDSLDVESMKVVQIDQRGCGKSKPIGMLENNTTTRLLEDIERVRKELKIDKWVVSAGSWGSTLALLYAEKHPASVMALSLSSIFLGRKQDISWLFSSSGAGNIFPDEWAEFNRILDQSGVAGEDWMSQSLNLITTKSNKTVKKIVAGIGNYENSLDGTLVSRKTPEEIEKSDIASIAIFLHYMVHNLFIKDGQIIDEINKINKIPTVIIHGRYDIVCPLSQAFLLDSSLSKSELSISSYSGHGIVPESRKLLKQMTTNMVRSL